MAIDAGSFHSDFLHLQQERARLETEVRRLQRAVINARSPAEAARLRAHLDETEENLLIVERRLGPLGCEGSCEGWPLGK